MLDNHHQTSTLKMLAQLELEQKTSQSSNESDNTPKTRSLTRDTPKPIENCNHTQSELIPLDNKDYRDLSQIEITQTVLGKGTFGCVYKGKLQGNDCAIKEANPDSDAKARSIQKVLEQELKILNKLAGKNTPHVVEFYGAFKLQGKDSLYLVTEYMTNGSLHDQLNDVNYHLVGNVQRIKWITQIATGVDYLHSQGILHNDLKPKNILITNDRYGNIVKICDLGSGTILGQKNVLNQPGSVRWQAPEVFKARKYSTASDSFSLGIVCWQIMTGEDTPYKEMQTKQEIIKFVTKGGRPSIPKNYPYGIAIWTEKAWHQNPKKRPEPSEIKEAFNDGTILEQQKKKCWAF